MNYTEYQESITHHIDADWDIIEMLFWEYDAKYKRTGQSRYDFKLFLCEYSNFLASQIAQGKLTIGVREND